jgi:hypothetical protein
VPHLALVLLLLMPVVAQGAERDYLLRWFCPPQPDVAGYEIYVALESMPYDEGVDIGYVAPDPNGVASFLLEGLDAGLSYSVVMTAYDSAQNVSAFSNELVIPALACDPAACDDRDACTADACSGGACTNDPVPDGTPCDDGDVATDGDHCAAGVCAGVLPVCVSDAACDDGNACTADRCIPAVGCVSSPVAHGVGCGGVGSCTPVYFSFLPTAVPDQSPRQARIILKNLHRPGRQQLTATGYFNPATTTPEIDPSMNGVHFVLQDGGGILYELSIPGGIRTPRHPNGLCDPRGRDGWHKTGQSRRTVWRYTNVSGKIPLPGDTPGTCTGSARGIRQLVVKDLTRTGRRAFQYLVISRNATFLHTPAFPITTMQAELIMAAPPSPGAASAAADVGQCVKSVFSGSPVPQVPRDASRQKQAFCRRFPARGTVRSIDCRGL